jgi:ADP-L-glycero-D-manno-heptose 6-epimerase|tara:strand:+ start:1092 stop:1952 length:861 start_codon:yes stop_codon:yes gene_type:complete
MIVVTGASGFIGSHIANVLHGNVACCDISEESMMTPSECHNFLINTQKSIDCVIHVGGISSTTESDIIKLTNNNILYSCDILSVCIDRDIPFVYASSASVYGLGDAGFKEDSMLSPLNYYAISKASFDMFALQKIKDNPSAKIFGLRYFNVYGSGEDKKGNMASPIHKFLNQAIENNKIEIFVGSEKFVRDFIHIDDVVSITIAAKDFSASGIYNVGTGCTRSFKDVAEIISEKTKAKIIEIPFPKNLLGKYQKFTCSDNAKINLMEHTKNRISLEDGITKVISGE